MTINVVFDKNGFYHPAFGRMGRTERNRNKVYALPDIFGEPGNLPSTAKIISDPEQLEEFLEDNDQLKPEKPKVVEPVELEKLKALTEKRRQDLLASKKKPKKADPTPDAEPPDEEPAAAEAAADAEDEDRPARRRPQRRKRAA